LNIVIDYKIIIIITHLLLKLINEISENFKLLVEKASI